jgi:transcriptional regulator GlxA family with amidase domain
VGGAGHVCLAIRETTEVLGGPDRIQPMLALSRLSAMHRHLLSGLRHAWADWMATGAVSRGSSLRSAPPDYGSADAVAVAHPAQRRGYRSHAASRRGTPRSTGSRWCRDGLLVAKCRPPVGHYERLTHGASGAYDRLATVYVMHVGLLASDGCFSSGLTALIDVLATAQAQRPGVDPSIPPIRIDVTGTGRNVTTGAGLTVPVTMPLRELPAVDVVVVPALGTMTAEDTLRALTTHASRAIIRVLGDLDPQVTTVAAACTGVFTLAESGLLDRRRATTSWWLGAAFRSRYPSVVLDLDSMVVADAGVLTAGAAFAHIDLALALVRRVSPSLAEHIARLLVIDERASQSAYLVMDHLDHDDALVRAFEQQVRARLGRALDVRELAAAIGTSPRTLERRTQAALGMSPLVLVQRLRAERAVHLLRTTAQSIEQIAPQVGYNNASTLRALLRREQLPARLSQRRR